MKADFLNMGFARNWVKHPHRFDTYINYRGDQITFLNRNHALINGKQVLGFLNIYTKMLQLTQATGF